MAKGTSVRRGNPRLFGVGGFEGMGWKREVGCVGEWGFELVEEGEGDAVGGWWLEREGGDGRGAGGFGGGFGGVGVDLVESVVIAVVWDLGEGEGM